MIHFECCDDTRCMSKGGRIQSVKIVQTKGTYIYQFTLISVEGVLTNSPVLPLKKSTK